VDDWVGVSGCGTAYRLPPGVKAPQPCRVHHVLQPWEQKVLLVSDALPDQRECPLQLLPALRIAGRQPFAVGHQVVDLLVFFLDPCTVPIARADTGSRALLARK
jgi:hypothetical protein